MTLNANTINISVIDESGDSSFVRANIPSSVAEAAALTFTDAFADVCAAAMTGGITGVGVTLYIDLSGLGLKTVAAALSDTAEKLYLGYRSVIGGFAKMFLPTIDETLLLADGTPDPAETDLTDFITTRVSGIELADSTIVQPCDTYGSDIVSLSNVKEYFKKKGKPRQ